MAGSDGYWKGFGGVDDGSADALWGRLAREEHERNLHKMMYGNATSSAPVAAPAGPRRRETREERRARKEAERHQRKQAARESWAKFKSNTVWVFAWCVFAVLIWAHLAPAIFTYAPIADLFDSWLADRGLALDTRLNLAIFGATIAGALISLTIGFAARALGMVGLLLATAVMTAMIFAAAILGSDFHSAENKAFFAKALTPDGNGVVRYKGLLLQAFVIGTLMAVTSRLAVTGWLLGRMTGR